MTEKLPERLVFAQLQWFISHRAAQVCQQVDGETFRDFQSGVK